MKTEFVLSILLALPLSAQTDILQWMDGIAQQQLDAREATIDKIRTQADAARRQREARDKVLELIGGLPNYQGPLNARVTGEIRHEAYVIEKVIFESLPRYLVTANLYRPTARGRYPGVLLPLGHWEQGKPAVQRIAANLALKGFVVLVYDPVGQGERLQAFDKRLDASLTPGATTQHILSGAQSFLMGESFARYRIWDAKRALDYLVSRPEVDGERIGCTGCSGGGTLATFISALDPRIKVAAPTCYMNSFRVLFRGSVGDSEQSFPNFLAAGLDQTDFVELFAPKPWLIGTTKEDFFTPEGARLVYEEARRWYRIYGAEEKVKWVVGPGPHGTPLEVREAIYDWMIRWLKDGKGEAREQEAAFHPNHELWATKTGQVSNEGSRDLFEIIRERPKTPADLSGYLRHLIGPMDHSAPKTRVSGQKIMLESEPGFEIAGKLFTPAGTGPFPALLLVDEGANQSAMAERIAARGFLVLALTPRGLPVKADPRIYPGDWLANTRAWMIGKNLPALRARDIVRGVDYLASRPDVRQISASAKDVAGVWLLVAAAVDPRISRIWLDRTPSSFRFAFNSPVHRSLHDAAMPGFTLHWDIADIAKLIAPRQITWTDPADWLRNVAPVPGDFRYRAYDTVEEDLPGLRN